MKTIKSYILRPVAITGMLLALAACSEEAIDGVSKNGLPQAGDYNIVVTVDQETNQYTLNIDNPVGVFPVWKIYLKDTPTISTRNGYSGIIVAAGDYEVEMQVGNRNGISEGVKTATIHIENTKIDYTPYIRNLTDGSSKEWHIAGDLPAHLGCGESGSDGLNWWSANPGDKESMGVYANKMIFAMDENQNGGLYTYDPGESGTIYVNTGITDLSPYSDYNTNDGQDYCAPADVQANVPFQLSADGTDLVLTLPKGTLFGYLPNMEFYNEPKFKVNSISKSKVELTCDNGAIAWHYILAPFEAPEPVFSGYKYDSEFNLWKDATLGLSTWFADGGWGEISAPEIDLSNELISFTAPDGMGNDQWQGQVHISTDIMISAAETYDFSMFVNAPVDTQITVKPHPEGDDDTYFVADKQSFAADGSCYYFSDLPGFDGKLVLTLDVAGNPGVAFEISNIVIKKHSDDDGTVLPTPEDPEPEVPVTWVDVDSDDNLFKGCTYTNTFWYAPGWAQISDPELTVEGNSWTLSLPEATTDQWQAQFAFATDIATSADKSYDFRVTFYSTTDLPGVTFKCVLAGGGDNDNVFYMADRVAVEAYEDMTFKWVNLPGMDINPMNIVLDFGGNPAGTEVTVKDIIIQEHRD